MVSSNKKSSVLVVGGGIYGCYVAENLAKKGYAVTLSEKDGDLFTRASAKNQARIHGGYHYPRSFKTAIRSRVGLQKFLEKFPDSVDRNFKMVYAIAKNSKVSANQFKVFCKKIEAPCVENDEILSQFNSKFIQATFTTEEFAFDYRFLKDRAKRKLHELGVNVTLDTQIKNFKPYRNGFEVCYQTAVTEQQTHFDQIFLAAYAGNNELIEASGLPELVVQKEWAEVCLIEVPAHLKKLGITVIDGSFFSFMPFPSEQMHSLTHVRFTPRKFVNNEQLLNSQFSLMIKDASRYFPEVMNFTHRKSLFEMKVVLPRENGNDSRPILYLRDYHWPGLHVVMGGKIDNIFEMALGDEI